MTSPWPACTNVTRGCRNGKTPEEPPGDGGLKFGRRILVELSGCWESSEGRSRVTGIAEAKSLADVGMRKSYAELSKPLDLKCSGFFTKPSCSLSSTS